MDRSRLYIQSFYRISASIEEESPLLNIIKNYEEQLSGGFADGKMPSDFDQSQLLRGMKIEMEHTDNPTLALEIAMDHLEEMSDYYTHLEQMEKEAEQTHGGKMKTTKAEVRMALASMGIEIIDDKIRKSDLAKVLGKEKSLRPPKKWFDKMEKEIKEGNPSYDAEQIKNTIGDIWYHKLSDAKRKEIREREGKEYGPANEEE